MQSVPISLNPSRVEVYNQEGQSRDTGNIEYTGHRTKTIKTNNMTQKTKKDE